MDDQPAEVTTPDGIIRAQVDTITYIVYVTLFRTPAPSSMSVIIWMTPKVSRISALLRAVLRTLGP